MDLVGYKLINVTDNSVVEQWGGIWGQHPNIPNPITLPNGDIIYSPELDTEYNNYKLIEWKMDKPINPIVDGLEFLARFTDAEYGGILQAALTNVQISRWMDMLRINKQIDVTGVDATAGKTALVSLNLLTPERADIIFQPN